MRLVGMYLAAIVAANLLVTRFGPWALPLTSWVLIPFDFLVRDVLHHRWEGRWLWPRMAALVLSGSALSFAVNTDAMMVAAASFCAFACAGFVNAVAYAVLRRRERFVRMNASNAFAAVADSLVFPAIAFSMFDPVLSASQAGAKFLGGVFWSALFLWWVRRGR